MTYFYCFLLVCFFISLLIIVVGFDRFKNVMLFKRVEIQKFKNKNITKYYCYFLGVSTWIYMIYGIINLIYFLIKL